MKCEEESGVMFMYKRELLKKKREAKDNGK